METPKPKSRRKLILAITGGLHVFFITCIIIVASSGNGKDSGQAAQATAAPIAQATEARPVELPTATPTPPRSLE